MIETLEDNLVDLGILTVVGGLSAALGYVAPYIAYGITAGEHVPPWFLPPMSAAVFATLCVAYQICGEQPYGSF